MRHLTVLIIKFIACTIAFAIGLDLFFDANIVDVLSFSLTVTVASYLLGELIVLKHFNSTAATIADFLLAYMSVWIFGSIVLNDYMQIAWGSIISAVIITGAEVLVHRYLTSNDSAYQSNRDQAVGLNPRMAYITEFAEDEELPDKKNDPKE
jgi:Protein of unknown function (DUF2512)